MHKKISRGIYLLPLLYLSAHGITQAQNTVTFGYDKTGNRIQRKTLVMSPRKGAVPASGKDTLGNTTITIAPNPTNGAVKISMDNTNGDTPTPVTILVYDYVGKLIGQQQGITGTADIDLSPYPAGAYQLKLRSGNNERVWKIIKE